MNESAEKKRAAFVENSLPKVSALVEMFADFPSHDLIRNLGVRMEAFTADGCHFPVSLNDAGQAQNCYICCPSTAYIDYAIDETRNFSDNPKLHRAVAALVRICAPLVRASGLDHQVQLNNWLFSTNPVPELKKPLVERLIERLTADHPQRAIVVRSLNERADPQSIAVLKSCGFRMLAMRQIYLFRDGDMKAKHRNTIRRDQRLIAENGLIPVENDDFAETDFKRCEELYNMLYLDKYTRLNPQYTAAYIREMRQRGLLKLSGARDTGGKLIAVTGLFENGTTLTQPIVGYDTTLPQSLGLYRIAMSIAQQYAMRHDMFFNMSAGAAEFKRNRGAEPVIEYMAVYNRHLGAKKRMATATMRHVLKRIGIPLLKSFEL